MEKGKNTEFIAVSEFYANNDKPGRTLSEAKIGGVFMSELEIEPGVITGGYYHTDTEMIFYVRSGRVRIIFEQVNLVEKKEFIMESKSHVAHVPSYVRCTAENIGEENAVVVFFSNNPIRKKTLDEPPLRKDLEEDEKGFVTLLKFEEDSVSEGRSISSVKVGGIYMTKMDMEPRFVTGNYYHEDTDVTFYCGGGKIEAIFEQVNTGERKEILLEPTSVAVQIPAHCAFKLKNIGEDVAELTAFSNRRTNDGDEIEYKL